MWSFTSTSCESNYFYFIFDYVDSTGLDKYEFNGDITIYIYYNNASKEVINNIINNDTYNLEICYVKCFSKPEIYI